MKTFFIYVPRKDIKMSKGRKKIIKLRKPKNIKDTPDPWGTCGYGVFQKCNFKLFNVPSPPLRFMREKFIRIENLNWLCPINYV
jgi:hypothetical protein